LPDANLAELVGLNDTLGLDVSVTERPDPGRLPFQFGTCANGKNCDLGASVGLNYKILANSLGVTNPSGHELQVGATGYGDVNINLTRVELPEPGTLAIFSLGLAGFRFAKRKKTL